MADKDLHILQHSLGTDQYGRGSRYRNYFAADAHSEDFKACCRLVARGLMVYKGPYPCSDLATFIVTQAGKDFVSTFSPPPPRLTRSQKRYRAFLDADSGYSFGEWLKMSHRCPPSAPTVISRRVSADERREGELPSIFDFSRNA